MASYITVLAKPVASFTFNATPVVQGSRIQFTNTSTSSTSYQWTFEGGTPASSTELNPMVTYSKSGSYKVSLTAINALGSNTKEQTVLVTIIPKTEDVATKAVKVYPNPFSGEFTLDFTDGFTGEILVNIFEMNGALVSQKRFDKQQETFNVKITSGLKSGVYLLQVQSGTNTYNTRVISIN